MVTPYGCVDICRSQPKPAAISTLRFHMAFSLSISAGPLLALALALATTLVGCGGGSNQEVSDAQFDSKLRRLSVGIPNTLSAFSRANCINNESITWDNTWAKDWWMAVDSFQTSDTGEFVWEVCDTLGKRCAAVSWGAGVSMGKTWEVDGYHYVSYEDSGHTVEVQDQIRYLEEWCDYGWQDTGPRGHWTSGECKVTKATSCNITEW